jgi:hypothetical protein
MAISRRFFLFGAGALTTLPFARTAEAFAARRNLPILIPPEKVTETLYATPDGYLYLGRPDWPEWPTWAEFFSNHVGETVDQDSLDRWSIDEEASLEDDVHASVWEDYVGKHYAPNTRAFQKLRGIQLGAKTLPHHKCGWPKGVEFIEGHHPADASLFVRTTDLVALSLLQARLTELGTGIAIEQIEEYIY